MEHPRDDRSVGRDRTVHVENEVHAADRALPVVLREALVFVGSEGHVEQLADRLDLERGQLAGREESHPRDCGGPCLRS